MKYNIFCGGQSISGAELKYSRDNASDKNVMCLGMSVLFPLLFRPLLSLSLTSTQFFTPVSFQCPYPSQHDGTLFLN
jgi:hypothetical protein